jgi:flagellar hook-length control protein FliK
MSELLPPTAPAPSPAPSPPSRGAAPRARAAQAAGGATPARRGQAPASGATAFADALAEAGVAAESGPIAAPARRSAPKDPTAAPAPGQNSADTPPLTICVAPVVIPAQEELQGQPPVGDAREGLVEALAATLVEGQKPDEAIATANGGVPADAPPPNAAVGPQAVVPQIVVPQIVVSQIVVPQIVAPPPTAVAQTEAVPVALVADRAAAPAAATVLAADVAPTVPRVPPPATRAADAQAEPALAAEVAPVDVGDAIDTPLPSRPVATAAPPGAAVAGAPESVTDRHDAGTAPVQGPAVADGTPQAEPRAADARSAAGVTAGPWKTLPNAEPSRVESRRAARAAVRAVFAQDEAATEVTPTSAAAPASTPVARTLFAPAAPGAAVPAEPSAVAATPARVPGGNAPLTDAAPEADALALTAAAPPTDGRPAQATSPREARASDDAYAPLRALAASSRTTDVLPTADGAQAAGAWMARLAEASATTPGATATLTTATAQAWGVPDQIVRGLQLQMRNGTGEAVIRLHPEHLGEIVVEMKVERDGVVATLKSDTPAVRAWMAAHRDDLEAGLADSGLRLDDLRVSDREAGRDRRERQQDDEAPRRRARRATTDTGARFEVVV